MQKKFLSKNARIVLIVLAIEAILVGGFLLYAKAYRTSDSFTVDGRQYTCSKEIPSRRTTDGEEPKSQEDFSRYCRPYYEPCGGLDNLCVEEYRAVLDILKREDVASVMEKYDSGEAWVRALHHDYIHDKDYLAKILPEYSNMKIDCVIVVHSPEGTRFFVENGDAHKNHDDHQYLEVPSSEFLASLNAAPDKDATDFWLNLR